jgi:outer membrane protein
MRPHTDLRTVAIFATVALMGTTTAHGADPPATLRELVLSAIASHEDVERASSQLRRAQADVRLTSSALYPRVEINGQWTRFADSQEIEFAPGQSFEIRPLTDWNWSADLRQTLFYGLRDWRARDVALLQRDIARLDRSVAVNDLTLDVSAAFYGAVASRQRVEVQRTALDEIQAQLRVAERRFEVGEVAVADVARWRAEVAAARQRLVVAEGDAELTRRRLGRLVGAPELGDLDPPGQVPVPVGTDQELVGEALGQRLEMATLRHQLEAAGLIVKVRRGAWYPELEAHAQYFQQKSLFPSEDWVSVSLNLKVPIYDGGLTAAQVAKAKEDVRRVELLELEVTKAISDQVESAAIRYRSATAALEAARERTEAAREA